MRALAWPFWNAEERRPRALVRVAIHLALFSAAMLAVSFATGVLGVRVEVASVGITTATAIGVTWICARLLDRRRFGDLGLRPRPGYLADVLAGTVLGGLCMAAVVLIEDSLGLATYHPRAASLDAWLELAPRVGSSVSMFVGIAVWEELVMRGYLLTNLAEGMARGEGAVRDGRRHPVAVASAIALSSIAFGLGHAGNPNATVLSVLLIAFGGLFLALPFVTQGDLALPIGLHLGWNLFQNLFGIPVSGITQLQWASILVRTETGPDVLTGGAFGAEGGLTGLVAMALGIALGAGWVRARTGRVRVVARLGRPPRRAIRVPAASSGA